MSESSETNPQILVNGEHQEQQQDATAAAAEEEQLSSVSQGDAEKETQARVQSVFQQVRNQIRSQGGVRAPKSSILELVQRVKDRGAEIAQVNGEPEGKDVSGEEKKRAEMLAGERKNEKDLKGEELSAMFEKKLEASKKAFRDEFEVQMAQVRKEMQAYTDQALKDLECKMQSRQSDNLQQAHPKEQQESKGPDKKQRPSAAPTLASRRGRVLTRTMTTIIPKTCAPVIIGPRAKSETLSSSKGETSLLRDPVLSLPGNKQWQSRKPLLPPACPPLHQRKKPVGAKAKTVN